MSRPIVWIAAVVFVCSACAGVTPLLRQAPVTDDAALLKAVEDFYRAGTPGELKAAVAAAAPASARFHEIAAELATLEGNDDRDESSVRIHTEDFLQVIDRHPDGHEVKYNAPNYDALARIVGAWRISKNLFAASHSMRSLKIAMRTLKIGRFGIRTRSMLLSVNGIS